MSPWAYAAWVVLSTRVLFFAVAWSASFLLATDTMGLPDHGFFEIWNRSDARAYLAISEAGYHEWAPSGSPYGFFPLYPLAISLLGLAGIPPLAAALLVSALGSWVALAFLCKLAADESGPKGRLERGRRAVLYLAVFPTAVFLVAPYSESLFLAGAIPAFYFARRRAWHVVGAFAAVASATHWAGVFLLLGLAVEAVRQTDAKPRSWTRPVLALAVGAIPLAAYAAYLARVTSTPFYFVTGQLSGWGRGFAGPFAAFRNTAERWNDPMESAALQAASRIEVLAAVVGLLFVAWAIRKREWGYSTYMGATLAMLLTGAVYSGVPRALLALFPAAVFAAGWTVERHRVHELYLAVASALAAASVIVFTQGAWLF